MARTDISAALLTEEVSRERTPHSVIEAELYLPRWEKALVTLSAGKLEQYALGHCACTSASVSDGRTKHKVHRFRSGSAGNPQDGILYHAHYDENDIDSLSITTWDASFSASPAPGDSGLMYPAWTASSGASWGGSLDCVWDELSGNVFVFVPKSNGEVHRLEFQVDGTFVGSSLVATFATDDTSLSAMYLAAIGKDELFITRYIEVEPSRAAWHKAVYGTAIHRYYYSGGWQLDDTFDDQQHTHIYAGPVKDSYAVDAPTTQIINQWGKRFAGGLSANKLDDNRVMLSFGATYYHRYGQDTHSQAIYSYIFYRDSQLWELVTESGTADYQFEDGLQLDLLAAGSDVYDTLTQFQSNSFSNMVVWSRFAEPVDVVQSSTPGIPRNNAVVYARVRSDGRQLSGFQNIGDVDVWSGARICLARGNAKAGILLALGWRAVAWSPIANIIHSIDRDSWEYTTVNEGSQWWLGDGSIDHTDVAFAYQFINAPSEVVALQNRNNPGTYDAVKSLIAPAWTTEEGFDFSTSEHSHLDTGRVPMAGDTVLILLRYSDEYGGPAAIYGSRDPALPLDYSLSIRIINATNISITYADGDYLSQTLPPFRLYNPQSPTPSTHVIGMFADDASQKMYIDGVTITPTTSNPPITPFAAGSLTAYLGWYNRNPVLPNPGTEHRIAAAVVYTRELTGPEMNAVVSNMLALESSPSYPLAVPPDGDGVSTRGNIQEANIISQYEVRQGNRFNSNQDAAIPVPTRLFDQYARIKPGGILKYYLGNSPTELAQIAQGFIDLISPAIGSDPQFRHGAKVTGRSDKQLQDIRAETTTDLLPHNTKFAPPYYPITDFARFNGKWGYKKPKWPTLFFPGQYPELEEDRGLYRLSSSPEAATGGELADPSDPTSGGGGAIWDDKADKVGTWWNEVVWTTMPTMVDGSIQAAVRFGDDENQGDYNFMATTGHRVYATLTRSNDGLIIKTDWRTGGYGGPIWNTVAQEATMAGLICHAVDIGKKYAFVWEANSDFDNSSHTDDTWKSEDFDSADLSAFPVGSNKLYLIMSDFDGDDPDWRSLDNWINLAVAGGVDATGLTPGKPAELRMVVSAGTIYCFYRNYVSGNTKEPWRFALKYKAGRFGAGKFGLIARGHSGIQWDYLVPGAHYINKTDNVVDFWDIHQSDGVIDKTIEDDLKYIAWLSNQVTEYKRKVALVDQATVANTPTLLTDQLAGQPLWMNEVVIDAEINLLLGEVGFVLRADDSVAPLTGNCILLTLEIAASNNLVASTTVDAKLIYRRYLGGVVTFTDYMPIHIDRVFDGNTIPVRVTALGYRYSMWIAGKYVGHFIDDTEMESGYNLFYSNQTAADVFKSITVQELYEVPDYAIVDINQPIMQAISKVIGRRRIKGFFKAGSDSLLISYFLYPDDGGDYEERLVQSNYKTMDRFVSVVTCQGACYEATYQHPTLIEQGRHYMSVSVPEIMSIEHCWLEARAILKEIYERTKSIDLVGLMNWSVEPEDKILVVVAQQRINGDFIVDDKIVNFNIGGPDGTGVALIMGLGVRLFINTVEGI